MRSKADGSNYLESFSNEKIPGGFQGFKNHFPHLPVGEDYIYNDFYIHIYYHYLDFTKKKRDAGKN